jgi:hypothetical protein
LFSNIEMPKMSKMPKVPKIMECYHFNFLSSCQLPVDREQMTEVRKQMSDDPPSFWSLVLDTMPIHEDEHERIK